MSQSGHASWASSRPRIVAIIGSSRFRDQMYGIAQRETLNGKIVISPGFYHHVDRFPISHAQKLKLDELMLRKIDLADEVVICNVNGYIGASTRAGIEYCDAMGKPYRKEWNVPDLEDERPRESRP